MASERAEEDHKARQALSSLRATSKAKKGTSGMVRVCVHTCVCVLGGGNAPSTPAGAGTGGEIMQNWGMGNGSDGVTQIS